MRPKYLATIVGLAAPGVLGFWATTAAPAQDTPGAPATSPAVIAAAPSSAAAPTTAVALLHDGRILSGEISENDAGYVVQMRVGPIKIPRRSVERIFPSMRELYEYRNARIPREDPDELMKFAQWCLQNNLKPEATVQLESILELVPDHRQARAMLANVRSTMEAQARMAGNAGQPAPLDLDVQRTDAVGPITPQPEPLSEAEARKMMRAMGERDIPIIFDLPPALAVKRAAQFNQNVHKVLQNLCANCHNERYNGSFQLIQTKLERDFRNPDIRRQNLDAALSLVTPENLAQSPLLANALLPHGPNKKPILNGPNSPYYRVLSAWVLGLQVPSTLDARVSPAGAGFAGRGGYDQSPVSNSGGFGSARYDNTPGLPQPNQPRPQPELMAAPGALRPPTPTDFGNPAIPAQDGGPAPSELEFPVSPLVEGQVPGAQAPARMPAADPRFTPAGAAVRPTQAGPEIPPPDDAPMEAPLPLENMPEAAPMPPDASARPAKKPPKKIDQRLLDTLLRNRNGR